MPRQRNLAETRCCLSCGEILPISSFSPNGAGRGPKARCRPCLAAERLAAWRLIHPPQRKLTVTERFWAKVDKSGECWLWTAGLTHSGYGKFGVQANQTEQAHRFAWEQEHGPIPPGMFVCHHCDTPRCVRAVCRRPDCQHIWPDCDSHLFLGTQQDNMQDALGKGRMRIGERSPRAKLTAIQVQEIRTRYAAETISHGRLAADYGVSPNLVRYIVTGKLWKHLPAPEPMRAAREGWKKGGA